MTRGGVPSEPVSWAAWTRGCQDRTVRILILGGTWFLGRTLAEASLRRGWSVTTFNRGRSGRDVDGVEVVRGDRSVEDDVARLIRRGPWDAVIDTSGHEPGVVQISAQALRDHVGRYVYISTVNVYQGWPAEPLTDESPVRESRPDLRADVPGAKQGLAGADIYGRFKAGCELAVRQAFADERTLILRPGVLLGPYEYVGRLPWLLRRMERGGKALAAGPPDRPIQPVDVRDLAEFALDAVERGDAGAMNATAPIGHSTYGELLAECRSVTGHRAELIWVAEDWLARQDVRQWSEIPLWRTTRGAWNVRSDRAWSLGLHCRPLVSTVADTWAWLRREQLMPHGRQAEIGLSAEKEQALLDAWARDE